MNHPVYVGLGKKLLRILPVWL